jgi:thiol-activated cytolysin
MKKISILMFVFLLIAALGCKKDKDVTDLISIEDVIDTAGEIPIAAEKNEINVEALCPDGTVNEESHSIAKNFNKITYLGLNDDVLWPGNIIKGDRITSNIYEPVSLERAPVTLSINLEGSTGGGNLSTTINDPSLSTVRQGIHDIIESSVGVGVHIPAKVEIEKTQVYSESHMNLAIGTDISYGGASLSSKFNFETNTQKTRIVARYKQIYYTINVDQPSSPADFFDPSITIEQAKSKMPPGSQPVYVSGVSYGAMAFMFIESDLSKELLNMAIDASYSGFGLDVEVTSEYTARQIFQQTSTSIVVYGGSTDAISTFTNINLDAFFDYINASSQFDPTSNTGAVPLSYSFRHLSNNTLAQVSLTSDYTIITPCHPLKYKVSLEKFHVISEDDGGGGASDLTQLEVTVRAFEYSNETNEELTLESLNQYTLSAYPVDPQERYICYYSDEGNGFQVHDGDIITTTPGDDNVISEDDLWKPEYMFHSASEYNTGQAGMEFTAYIREFDEGSTDEEGSGSIKVFLPDFNNAEGIHIFNVSSSTKFSIDVHVKIELLQ